MIVIICAGAVHKTLTLVFFKLETRDYLYSCVIVVRVAQANTDRHKDINYP